MKIALRSRIGAWAQARREVGTTKEKTDPDPLSNLCQDRGPPGARGLETWAISSPLAIAITIDLVSRAMSHHES